MSPEALRIVGGRQYPFVVGKLEKGTTPSEKLDLQPGDLVRVKCKEEIEATLDTTARNRGLSFDGEMSNYCGRTARVRARVNRLIEESNGEMIAIKSELHHPRGRRLHRRLPPLLHAGDLPVLARDLAREGRSRRRRAPSAVREPLEPGVSVRVDIGMPAYWRPQFIGEAIESVLAQTYANWSLVVSENGPGGGDVEAVVRRVRDDPRVRFVATGQNLGPAANWTRVLPRQRALRFTLIQDDDKWDPEFLARRVAFLERHPTCSFVYSGDRQVDENGRKDLGRPDGLSLHALQRGRRAQEGVYQPRDYIRTPCTASNSAGSLPGPSAAWA